MVFKRIVSKLIMIVHRQEGMFTLSGIHLGMNGGENNVPCISYEHTQTRVVADYHICHAYFPIIKFLGTC